MPNKKYFTKDAIQEICDLKIATFNTYISDFPFEPEEVIINSKRQKEYESLAVIRLLESKGKIAEGEKLYNHLTNKYESLLISKIKEPFLKLPSPDDFTQKLLNSNNELTIAVRNSSEANTKVHQTIQYFLKTQEETRADNQRLHEQNERLLRQVGKLLLLEEKRQEQLELQNTQKTDPAETSQPGFTIWGFTIYRNKPSLPQTALKPL